MIASQLRGGTALGSGDPDRKWVEAEAERRRVRAELIDFYRLTPDEHDTMTFGDLAIWARMMQRLRGVPEALEESGED